MIKRRREGEAGKWKGKGTENGKERNECSVSIYLLNQVLEGGKEWKKCTYSTERKNTRVHTHTHTHIHTYIHTCIHQRTNKGEKKERGPSQSSFRLAFLRAVAT